jgi:hypothetical protein
MKKSFLLTIFILVATAVPSFALPISGSNGVEGLGSFSGGFDFATSGNTSTITISLTNTSPAANGGFLTAFAFNIPSAFTLQTLTSDFDFVPLSYPVNAQPFGDDFDIGVALNNGQPSWEGGGNPTGGIGVGETGEFIFTLSGTDLGSLTTANFFSQPDPWFVARFRGFPNDGSDKVPNDPNTPVPEPTTMLLLGAGLSGLGFFSRKRFLK